MCFHVVITLRQENVRRVSVGTSQLEREWLIYLKKEKKKTSRPNFEPINNFETIWMMRRKHTGCGRSVKPSCRCSRIGCFSSFFFFSILAQRVAIVSESFRSVICLEISSFVVLAVCQSTYVCNQCIIAAAEVRLQYGIKHPFRKQSGPTNYIARAAAGAWYVVHAEMH